MKTKLLMVRLVMWCLVIAGGTAALHGAPAAAEERPLDAPRAAGLIGERYDGYAVVRDTTASAEIKSLVEKTNAERRRIYEQQASATGAPVTEVGKVYATEILQKVPAGTWFQGPDGSWTRR